MPLLGVLVGDAQSLPATTGGVTMEERNTATDVGGFASGATEVVALEACRAVDMALSVARQHEPIDECGMPNSASARSPDR